MFSPEQSSQNTPPPHEEHPIRTTAESNPQSTYFNFLNQENPTTFPDLYTSLQTHLQETPILTFGRTLTAEDLASRIDALRQFFQSGKPLNRNHLVAALPDSESLVETVWNLMQTEQQTQLQEIQRKKENTQRMDQALHFLRDTPVHSLQEFILSINSHLPEKSAKTIITIATQLQTLNHQSATGISREFISVRLLDSVVLTDTLERLFKQEKTQAKLTQWRDANII